MAAANPNPSRITDEMWWMWTEAQAAIPGVRLGGIWAAKSGYHNTVDNNQSTWPGNYSIRLRLDLDGPQTKARALDLTMSAAEMAKRTQRLLDAAARRDPRLRAVREFYGTTNGRSVVGRIKDSATGAWRSSTSDSSHLWHIHVSIFTKHCNDRTALADVMSVLSGGTTTNEGDDDMGHLNLEEDDSGDRVEALQIDLGYAGFPVPIDGEYGAKTSAAVLAMRKWMGSTAADGTKMTPYATGQLGRAVARREALAAAKDVEQSPGTFPQEFAIVVKGTATATKAG